MSEPDLNAQPVEPPPIHDAAPPLEEPAAPVEGADDDVIEIPTGEKLVPLSALQKARDITKTVKAERDTLKTAAERAAELEADNRRLAEELAQIKPRAQAYDAAVQAQTREPEQTGPTAAEKAELEEVARTLELYTADGNLDIARAAKVQELTRRTAERVSAERVAPIEQRSVQAQAAGMFQRALATVGADGVKPDPGVLQDVWRRLDPNLTATPEGAVQAWNIALGMTYATGRAKSAAAAKPAAQPLSDPLPTERAGGRDANLPTLRESDRRVARDLGMTEKEYAAELASMPEGWGKNV